MPRCYIFCMEFMQNKRLLRPTLITEPNIKAEFQLCKFIISSQFKNKLQPIKAERKRLSDQLIELEWKFMQEQARQEKNKVMTQKLNKQKISKEQGGNQINKLQKQISNYGDSHRKLLIKLRDRKQCLLGDKKYLEKLKKQNKHLEESINSMKLSNESIQKKNQKICFIIKQILQHESKKFNNVDKIAEQKRNIKQKIESKIDDHRQRLKLTKQKIRRQTQLCKIKQEQNQGIESQIQKVQKKSDQLSQKLNTHKIEMRKATQKAKEQKDTNYELNQKLKILRQKAQSLREKNKRLQNCKQIAIKSFQIFSQYTSKKIEETRKIECSMFDIEHCKQMISY